jgi:hypothetical protein
VASFTRVVLLATVAVLAWAAAPAVAAPALGRWEARGAGGARLVFTVIGAEGHRYVAHLVSFCGRRGEPEFDDWGVPGPTRDWNVQELGANGHFETGEVGGPKRIRGVLHDRRGQVHAHPWSLLAQTERCPASAYANLRARAIGPATVHDGVWRVVGTFGTTAQLRTYGGGALVQWSGTFGGVPPPKYPELPCQPVVIRDSTPIRARRFHDSYADALGGFTQASISGAFVTPTLAAGSYRSSFSYYDYVCTSGLFGVWVAELKRRPGYSLTPDRAGAEPPVVHVPYTEPKAPRTGPEPNTFRCAYRQANGPGRPDRPFDRCRPYARRKRGVLRLIWLRYGTTRGRRPWGYRHIAAKRGFSAKTDRYIAQTVARGTAHQVRKPPQGPSTMFVRTFRGHGRKCDFNVLTDERHGIITAYRTDAPKLGYVSGCP